MRRRRPPSEQRPSGGRRRPRLTVRVRMTVLVGLAAALVLIPSTVFGPNWAEQALLDDVFDDEAAAQAETVEVLVDLMARPIAVELPSAQSAESAQSAQSDPSSLRSGLPSVEMNGFTATELSLLTEEAALISVVLGDLDRLGHVDGLLAATGSSRLSGVPVVMSNGAVAAVSFGDGAEARRLDPASLDSAVISVFSLYDLAYEVDGIEPPGFTDKLGRAGLDGDASRDPQQIAFAVRSAGGADFVVAADIGSVIRSVDRIRSVMWLATPPALLAVVLLAWLLTGRALRPVEQITEQVREINAGTLGERVLRPGTGDEIDRLATTMNTMLDRLEHNDKRLRQFVSDASHELRTPVAVLRSEAEVALSGAGGSSVGDLAAGVLVEARRLQRIVDDLLVLARHDENRSPLSIEVIDLDDVVLEEAARSRAVPVDVSAVSAAKVAATADRAGRVVAHLLDNAAHHARERVAVSLTTRAGSGADSTTGREAVLTVDDDGPGIDFADRERIFERFTRLSEVRGRNNGGAGLGLAVVRALVTELGGRITVGDSPAGGARFTVTLPLTAP